jgi:hypothetical protein
MATVSVASNKPHVFAQTRRIPWYLWCVTLAVTSVAIGAHWDVSWHRSIGRDSFWTPAHIAIYACGVLAGIACGYLVFATNILRKPEFVASSVRVFGLRAPLGAFLAAWGGIAMLTSAPFDNWWHNAYGLDVKIISPPHVVLTIGIFAICLGSLILLLGVMNRSEGRQHTQLQWMILYIGGMMLVLNMFFRMEYSWDVYLHNSVAYKAMALGVPLYLAMLWHASRFRFASTVEAAIYTLFGIGLILILPLFPASPRLGPVLHPVTQFIPPKFPILLIVPAFALDLLWWRTRQWNAWLVALVSGPVFILTLLAVEWPFANFLMSKAAENRFFGTEYFQYFEPSTSPDVLRVFVHPQHGLQLWIGLLLAMLYASICVLLGQKLGGWMREVKR